MAFGSLLLGFQWSNKHRAQQNLLIFCVFIGYLKATDKKQLKRILETF